MSSKCPASRGSNDKVSYKSKSLLVTMIEHHKQDSMMRLPKKVVRS